MQQALGPYLENAILNSVLKNQGFPTITAVYLALWQGDPGETGTAGTEVTTVATGYVRQQCTFDTPVGGVTQLTNPVNFPAPTANYGAPVDHWALFDAISGGNFLLRGEFDVPVTVITSSPAVSVPAGDLSVKMA